MSTNIKDYNYDLPKELIAQVPSKYRTDSRLLVFNKKTNICKHRHFKDIIDYFQKDDVLVINETKVIKSKLVGKKRAGAPVDLFIERQKDNLIYECRIKTNKPKNNSVFIFPDFLECTILGRTGHDNDIFVCEFNKDPEPIIKQHGEMPHPTYIKEIKEEERYQTVFAKKEGSLAAPTAGLHFTPELITRLENKGVIIAKVCLHIGFGTFLPINNADITKHKMHTEYYEVSSETANKINNRKRRLFVTGTTSLRTLEAAHKNGKVQAETGNTDIFIYPGYTFKNKIDGMITNFHLPQSTLLLLVSALAGRQTLLDIYNAAIENKYRFYSFGDAMFFLF